MRTLILISLVFLSSAAGATVKLPALFQSRMVIQREKPVCLWGWADAKEKIRVDFKGESYFVETPESGQWKMEMPAQPAGGPYTLTVQGLNNTLVLEDVLIGDVWICGGQSNMQWTTAQTGYTETDSNLVANNMIRLLTVIPGMDYQPAEDIQTFGWQSLSAENIRHFSAVGYHFGKLVHQSEGVPVGLISNNLGATSAETWMSNETIAKFPQFREELKHGAFLNKSFRQLEDEFNRMKPDWEEQYLKNDKGIKEEWYRASTDYKKWSPITVAGNTWEEEDGLKDFDGVVWFQTSFDVDLSSVKDSFHLQLLQIDDFDRVWVNGVMIGETYGRHNHRNYKIPKSLLKETGNNLVVRVFDHGGIGGFTTASFWGNPILHGQWRYRKSLNLNEMNLAALPVLPDTTPFSSPTVLFNANIAPIGLFKIKGIIWYQGESNADRAAEYAELFPELIKDWRKNWNDPDLPFYFVQLANYGEVNTDPNSVQAWAELREAQAGALSLKNTGMAVAIDLGEAGDIHPRRKEEVAYRLYLQALAKTYQQVQTADAPAPSKVIFRRGAIIHFTENPAEAKTIRGFQIAGEDRKFYWAEAQLRKGKVRVKSPHVKKPVAVRYAWSNNPGELALYFRNNLPLAPFRTDDWPLFTEGRTFSAGPRF